MSVVTRPGQAAAGRRRGSGQHHRNVPARLASLIPGNDFDRDQEINKTLLRLLREEVMTAGFRDSRNRRIK
ncbi:hypothetical protein BaRGS_00033938 [Batillaria attramentaria]|uniref:Uncharacterized protein n=1 Tax=Batillaria attramentaria TaxID=370345 RepID=A0ABD0JIW9_9CAEN